MTASPATDPRYGRSTAGGSLRASWITEAGQPESDGERETRIRAAHQTEAARAVIAAHAEAVVGAPLKLAATGNDILKAVGLINGGAGAATLLFVSQIIQTDRRMALMLVLPLAVFGFGLTVATFATGWSYLAQEGQVAALALRRASPVPPFLDDTPASVAAASRAERHRRAAFAAVLVAMASTILGFATAGAVMVASLA